MKQKLRTLIFFFLLSAFFFLVLAESSYSQPSTQWTLEERQYYKTLDGLCHFLATNYKHLNIHDSGITKYILLDYVLKDTSKKRVDSRIVKITELLSRFGHFIDSAGLSNLDAKPIRFFKANTQVYYPFSEELKAAEPLTFAYYNKKDSEHPYGYLLFHRASHKLISWIILNQGGSRYFLTFNLM